MMFLLYSFLYTAVIAVLLIPQYLRRPPALRKKWLREKLGYLPEAGPVIWVHAVSVGEVGASIPLIKKLRADYPDIPVMLSTITDTGQKVATERVPDGTKTVYLPFDVPYLLKRSLRRVQPVVFIVIETELWPNIFQVMADKKVPVLVLNGRISEKSSRGYKRISFFMKKVCDFVEVFGMQSAVDAERLKGIGCKREKIRVIGNFKFDLDMPREIPDWTREIPGPVIVAGSTFRGEEERIILAFRESRKKFPSLKLIIAPRHPERFGEVEALLKARNIHYVKRSEIRNHPLHEESSSLEVVLLDTVGELAAVYGAADIALIGKSFSGSGGQNPLEPAYWGKAIICGPSMENFPFVDEFYREGAAFRVSADELEDTIDLLLSDPSRRSAAGSKARALVQKHAGAVDRAMEMVRNVLLRKNWNLSQN